MDSLNAVSPQTPRSQVGGEPNAIAWLAQRRIGVEGDREHDAKPPFDPVSVITFRRIVGDRTQKPVAQFVRERALPL